MTETVISSFILRFTQETGTDAPWRGVARHVQSDEEARFMRIDEALRFIGRFVALDGSGAADDVPLREVYPREQPGWSGKE